MKKGNSIFRTMRICFTIWLFSIISVTLGQSELTIYVIPSTVSYDWSSPHSLIKSYFKNYKRDLFKKERHLLGHAFVELKSPLLSERIFTGMKPASVKEQKNLVLKQHYGLAILGADTEGKLETDADLIQTLEKFSRKGQLAFMTFYISDEAAERMIRFYQMYKAGIESIGSPGARYGGAFYPRYEGEGAGCSAFVVSFLDLAGLLQDDFDDWLVKIDIPMNLIGGPYNSFNEVKVSDIKKCDHWAGDIESDSSDYEHFEIYDPSLMYDWIHDTRDKIYDGPDRIAITPLQHNKAKGILIDGRNQAVPELENIFIERKTPSIFIDYYFQK